MTTNDDWRIKFGKRVYTLRKARKLKQEEMSKLSKIGRTEISSIENGRRSIKFSRLVTLANTMQVEIFSFFNDAEELPVRHVEFQQKTANEESKEFGKRLMRLRDHRSLTQVELEVLSNITHSDISRFETGKGNIELDTVHILAKALEVTIADLFDYNGPLPDNSKFKGKI